jgi:putative methionine-R-sulfoxide reductase with GAF domain
MAQPRVAPYVRHHRRLLVLAHHPLSNAHGYVHTVSAKVTGAFSMLVIGRGPILPGCRSGLYLEARMDPVPGIGELGVIIGRTKGLLLTEQTAQQAVDDLAEVARSVIDRAEGAGVSLIMGGDRISVGSTDSYVLTADRLQYELSEGPCLTAWATGEAQLIDDTTTDERWRRWNSAAAETGVRSCVTVPLIRGRESIGALKAYSRTPGAFSSADARVLSHLATAAAALLGHIQASDTPQRINAEVSRALTTRGTIDLARGILMERYDMSPDEALEHMLTPVADARTTMAELARTIIARQDFDGSRFPNGT